jgi:hypothetical protein
VEGTPSLGELAENWLVQRRRPPSLLPGPERATDSRPMHWRAVAIGQAAALDDASAAVAYAAGQDWLLTEGQPPHSICLTESGRVMVAKLKRR